MIKFTVPDMTCGACADRIGKAVLLAQLPPDARVEIDIEKRQVRLTQGASTEVAALVREAITVAGYKAEESLPATASADGDRAGGCCCAAKRSKSLDPNQIPAAQMRGCCA